MCSSSWFLQTASVLKRCHRFILHLQDTAPQQIFYFPSGSYCPSDCLKNIKQERHRNGATAALRDLPADAPITPLPLWITWMGTVKSSRDVLCPKTLRAEPSQAAPSTHLLSPLPARPLTADPPPGGLQRPASLAPQPHPARPPAEMPQSLS